MFILVCVIRFIVVIYLINWLMCEIYNLWLNVNKLYKFGSSGLVEYFCYFGGCDKFCFNLNIGD